MEEMQSECEPRDLQPNKPSDLEPWERYSKSRLDLESNEDSGEYWGSVGALIRNWKYHAQRAAFYESRLRQILPGSGLSLCHENLKVSTKANLSDITTEK